MGQFRNSSPTNHGSIHTPLIFIWDPYIRILTRTGQAGPHACETIVIGATWLELWLVDVYLTNYKISNSILYWPRYTDIDQIPYPTPTQKLQTRTLSPYPIMILSPLKIPQFIRVLYTLMQPAP